ncbi:MAG: ABC transporter permease [Piscirickettsiaceae bacterium CG_4_9_14_3_um_filter_43_564]|nr:Abi family protein [Thiomicrospira sp.]NCN67346.1 Abi family protein [Thiomicrospira sp.]NCO13586.1 Abi family protein [Thiomicrospira sp.]PJA66148.1 MAG: ABC transporter permease [Piscirickettsiaceae bacterium CG_4_9_14_3_um_filter_43_564]
MSKVPFQKPSLPIPNQVSTIKSRGMLIADDAKAERLLASIGYYRMSAYWYPFRVRKNGRVLSEFEEGTSLEQATFLYEFDRSLRILIIDAIERVEIAIRARVVNELTQKYNPFFHENPSNFHPGFNHRKWFSGVTDEVERSSDEFISHYKEKYDGFPVVPLWFTTEVMSLGKLSFMYQGLQNDDKKLISQHFNIHHKRLANWLHVITYVRNVCAHHSRLWNRELSIRADQTRDRNWLPPLTPRNDRIFYVLLMLRHLMKVSPNGEDWKKDMEALIDKISHDQKAMQMMGLTTNWKVHPIWK